MAHIFSCWVSGLCDLSAAKSTPPNFSLSIHPQVWFTLGPDDTSCIISQYLPRATEQFLRYSHAGENLQVYTLRKLEDLQCTAPGSREQIYDKARKPGQYAGLQIQLRDISFLSVHIHSCSSAVAYKLVSFSTLHVGWKVLCSSLAEFWTIKEMGKTGIQLQWEPSVIWAWALQHRGTSSRVNELEGSWSSLLTSP